MSNMDNNKEKKERKYNSGQFVKGNTIGMETRFQSENDMSSKYREEYCDGIIEYFSTPKEKLPTLEGYATSIGVLVESLERWADKHPRFENSFRMAKEMQKNLIIGNALDRTYDGNFAKFLLVNCHGMRDKQDVASEVKAEVSAQIDERTLKMIERVSARLHDNNNGN